MAGDCKYPEECRMEAIERARRAYMCGYERREHARIRCVERVYLAAPYSAGQKSAGVLDFGALAERRERFEAASYAAAVLMTRGYVVFSPISHSHPIAEFVPDDCQTHKFWLGQDFPWLALCHRMFVLMLTGWDLSVGIAREARFAARRGIPVEFLDPVNFLPVEVCLPTGWPDSFCGGDDDVNG